MRGKYTAEEVSLIVAEKIGMPYEKLWQLFVEDCKTMRVSKEVLEKLRSLRDRYIVILVTGNMDSFSRFTHPALGLDNYFDEISNSFNEGMLKAENGGELFLKYAKKYGVKIEDCIIFDDSPNVYNLFAKLGGTPYLITKEKDLKHYLFGICV